MTENKNYPKSSARFNWLFTLFSAIVTIGVFVDGYHHNHLGLGDQSFFTPWHAIFYGGFTAATILLLAKAYSNHKSGYPKNMLLPREYHYSLSGLVLFFLAGVGDMIWHIFFGLEANVDALLSPTHLLLALGGALIISGPFHSIWHNKDDFEGGPWIITLSILFIVSLLSFMTQFAHPIHHPWMSVNLKTMPPDSGQSIGVASIIIQTGIFMGMILMTAKRWHFPQGSFTFLFGLNTLLMAVLRDQYRFVIPAIIAGVIIDIIYALLRPNASRPISFRFFSATTPIIFYSIYTCVIIFNEGTWWSIHLWAGAIVISGITGLLLSYLVLPPARQENVYS